MRIRTGFHLTLAVGALLVVASIWLLSVSQSRTSAAVTRNQAMDLVFVEGMQLVQLTNEVLLYHESRAITQWQSKRIETDRAAGAAAVSADDADRLLIDRIAVDVRDMKPILEALVAEGSDFAAARDRDVIELLSSQLFQKAALTQASLRELKLSSDRAMEQAYSDAKTRQSMIFGLLAGAVLAFGIVVSMIFRRVVLRRIGDLESVIREVNAGNAGRRVVMTGDDEIGVVGRAFNRLLDQQESDRKELQETADRFRATFEQAAVGICHVGLDGRWLRVNRKLCGIVGCGADQDVEHCGADKRLGGALDEITHDDDVEVDSQLRQQLLDGRRETYAVEKRLLDRDGAPVWANLTVSLVRDPRGEPQYFIIVFEDISARKAAEQEIAFLAYHDALTRLPNRLLVRDRFQQAVAFAGRSGGKVAVIFLDLDNFKAINDTLGHPIGDGLLKAVASRLQECVREMDTISRQGGDEFLVTLSDIADVGAISRVADKLLARLSAPFDVDGHELSTSASMGIAIYPDDSDDFDSLMKKADVAMYQAKAAGRNTCRFFTEQMNVDASDRLTLSNGLRRALDRGEFVLHYQPQVDLATGTTVGLEALIRWQHPELGMIPPGRFIPVAEDNGLIVPMGEWVIREACRQVVQLAAVGHGDLTVAVNLSAAQFRRGELEATVERALADYGVPASSLELELTESMLLSDTESVLATVRRLKGLGVKLSIDDFGTGYSSLAYLKRFNVDRLKIDQSFVRDLVTSTDDAAIVRAIIQLARSLELRTIAEGVENADQLEALRHYGCDEIQGFFFARPMPVAELLDFLDRSRGEPARFSD